MDCFNDIKRGIPLFFTLLKSKFGWSEAIYLFHFPNIYFITLTFTIIIDILFKLVISLVLEILSFDGFELNSLSSNPSWFQNLANDLTGILLSLVLIAGFLSLGTFLSPMWWDCRTFLSDFLASLQYPEVCKPQWTSHSKNHLCVWGSSSLQSPIAPVLNGHRNSADTLPAAQCLIWVKPKHQVMLRTC